MAQFNSFYDILDISLLQKFCVEHGKEKLYAKGECFVREGETGRNFGFVKSGYFKYCTGRSNGEEAIGGFAFKNEALVDLSNSFMFGKPSNVTISAGCQSIVAEVTISDIKQNINIHYPNFLKDATSAIFSELYKRYVNILKKTPTERYIELLNDHPQLFDIVPLQEIASYLLITPVYLSRIRKSIQNKKSKKLS